VKKIVLLAGIVHAFSTLFAQNTLPFSGARSNGLANSTACVADEWALFNNPAGMGSKHGLMAAFTQTLHPRFNAFNATAVAVTTPLKTGAAAAGFYHTGDDLYSEQIAAAGYANTFGLASLGASLHLIQYRAEGFGQTHKVTLSLGGIAQLTPELAVGAHILNINQPRLADNGERIPTVMTLGLAYTFSDDVWATTEIQKDLDYNTTWRGAVEYKAHPKVTFRTGFSLNPGAAYLGVGLKPGKIGIDYAVAYNPETGTQHQASVRYTFKAAAK